MSAENQRDSPRRAAVLRYPLFPVGKGINHEATRSRQDAFVNGADWQAKKDAVELERLRRLLDAADRQIEARTGETAGERLFKALAKETQVQLNAVRELASLVLPDGSTVTHVSAAKIRAILDGAS